MGFSLTGTHVVFFIASVIVASAVSGVFIGVIYNVMTSYSELGERLQEQLDIEFKIISDPDNIPLSGNYYQFYLKNIGNKEISTSNETFYIFIDGEPVVTANFSFSDTSIQTEEVTILSVDSSEISSGDRTLRVVGNRDIEDEFTFTI